MVDEGTSKTRIREIMEEMERSEFNFKNYLDKNKQIKNSADIIESHLENFDVRCQEMLEKLEKHMAQPSWKTSVEARVIPLDVFTDLSNLYKETKKIVQWRIILSELYKLQSDKLSEAIGEVHGLQIQRETMEEIRKADQQRGAMFLDIIKNDLSLFEDRQLNMLRLIIENQNSNQAKIFENVMKAVGTMIDSVNKSYEINYHQISKGEFVSPEVSVEEFKSETQKITKDITPTQVLEKAEFDLQKIELPTIEARFDDKLKETVKARGEERKRRLQNAVGKIPKDMSKVEMPDLKKVDDDYEKMLRGDDEE